MGIKHDAAHPRGALWGANHVVDGATEGDTIQYVDGEWVAVPPPGLGHLQAHDEDRSAHRKLFAAVQAATTDSYQHTQGAASDTWTVTHGLGRYPAVTVLDSGGSQVECSVNHSSLNQVVITLSYAISGIATCS